MAPILNLVAARQSQHTTATPLTEAAAITDDVTKMAFVARFPGTGPAGLTGENDRLDMTEAIIDVLSVGRDRAIPVSAGRPDHLYVLVNGWAYREHILANGERQITDVMVPGDLWDGRPTPCRDEIRACGDACVAVLLKDAGGLVLQRSLERARDAEARLLRLRLASLGRGNSRQRVAHFIAEMHERVQRVGLARSGAFTWPLTQHQLADVVGLTPVHVNRVLRRLRSDGLVLVNRPRVFIPDLAALHAAAGFAEDSALTSGNIRDLPGS